LWVAAVAVGVLPAAQSDTHGAHGHNTMPFCQWTTCLSSNGSSPKNLRYNRKGATLGLELALVLELGLALLAGAEAVLVLVRVLGVAVPAGEAELATLCNPCHNSCSTSPFWWRSKGPLLSNQMVPLLWEELALGQV